MKSRWLWLTGWLLCSLLLSAGLSVGQTLAPSIGPGDDFDAQADSMRAVTRDRFELSGNVTFRSAGVLLQAEYLIYDRSTRQGEARGNVLYTQGGGRLAGDSIVFDLEKRTAEITNATGYLEQGILFRARRIEQLDDTHLRFEKGLFTTCTQPLPYWSFRVSSAMIVRDRYAHLYNMRLKAGPVPVFYSPYLFFPIKTDRASGLLLPQISFSDRLGSSLSNAFFWAIKRNQDATFFLDTYSKGSLGVGIEHRLLPSAQGTSVFSAYFLNEQGLDAAEGPERERWNVRYRMQQGLGRNGRLLADFNLVSDADYFLDFSRDLDRGSDPSALSRGEYILNRGYTSLNLRVERREQFFTDDSIIQSRLPEADVRLRSRRLGRSPFYLALESSAAILDKKGGGAPEGAYGRIDVLPTISVPLSPSPYLDITPTLKLRETYYTRALDPDDPGQYGDGLSREFMQFDTQILGPRLSRVFFDEEGNARLKSTIEPRLSYRYLRSPNAEDNVLVPRFDQVDVLPGDLNQFSYGIVSRLYARKVVRSPTRQRTSQNYGLGDDMDFLDEYELDPVTGLPSGEPVQGSGLPGDLAPDNRLGLIGEEDDPDSVVLTSPVEILNVSITQAYSLDQALSYQRKYMDTTGDGILDTLQTVDESPFSPVVISARVNPSRRTSLDARLGFDVMENVVSDASFSAGLYSPGHGFLNTTWFFRNGLDGQTLNSSRLRLSGGTSFFRNKISMALSLNYDATLRELQDQRYRFGYDTQCCGIAVEILNRDFVGTSQQEFRFVLNLRGIGNFLDLQSGGATQ